VKGRKKFFRVAYTESADCRDVDLSIIAGNAGDFLGAEPGEPVE